MLERVEVKWLDAQDHAQKWVDVEDAQSFTDVDVLISSIGYLVKKTDKYVTIAGDWDGVDKDFGRVTKIPTKMVQEIVEFVARPLQTQEG